MLLFWLRFFGYKRTARISRNYEDQTVCTPYRPRKSIAYTPATLCIDDGVAPLDDIANARKKSHRRSAIDLEREKLPIDVTATPGLRMSVDSIPNRHHFLGNLLVSYTDFVTTHQGRHAKIVKAVQRYSKSGVALKVFDKADLSTVQQDDVTKEIRILRSLKGCNGVVELETTFEDECFLTLVLKDCAGGTLINRLMTSGGSMGEEECVRHVAKPLVDALALLHGKGIVHRDLKPEHIVYDELDELHIIDFTSAARIGKDPLTSREGTLAYMAPEVATKPTPDDIFHDVLCNGISETDLPSYDEKVDIWSFGVVLVEALTGRQPFLSDSSEGLVKVQQQELQSDWFGGVLGFLRDREFLSVEGQDFLSSILKLNAGDRPSAKSLVAHPWLDLVRSDDST